MPCPTCKLHSWEGQYGYVYVNWLESGMWRTCVSDDWLFRYSTFFQIQYFFAQSISTSRSKNLQPTDMGIDRMNKNHVKKTI